MISIQDPCRKVKYTTVLSIVDRWK